MKKSKIKKIDDFKITINAKLINKLTPSEKLIFLKLADVFSTPENWDTMDKFEQFKLIYSTMNDFQLNEKHIEKLESKRKQILYDILDFSMDATKEFVSEIRLDKYMEEFRQEASAHTIIYTGITLV